MRLGGLDGPKQVAHGSRGMPRRSPPFLAYTAVYMYMLLLLATHTRATPILVTVQTQSQEQLDTLTQAIENDAQTEGEAGSVIYLEISCTLAKLYFLRQRRIV